MKISKSKQLQNVIDQQSILMDTVPVQMWFLTGTDIYGRVNESHAAFLGRRKQDIEFRKLGDIFSCETAELYRNLYRKVFEERKKVVSEQWIPDSNREKHLLQITVTPILDKEGEIEGIACSGIDVTQNRDMEQKLKRCLATLESSTDSIAITEMNWHLRFVNEAWAKIQNLSEVVDQQSLLMDTVPVQMWLLTDIETYGRVNQCHADFLCKQKQDIEFRMLNDIFPADVAEMCRLSNRRVFQTGETLVTKETIPDSNGYPRLVQITKTPKLDKRGKIEYIVCFGIDITNCSTLENEPRLGN